jgi:hypothetical protein
MPDLLIRNLDADAHRELKRRAEREGDSLQGYVARLLQAHASRSGIGDWLAQLDELEPVYAVSGADAVAAARADLP